MYEYQLGPEFSIPSESDRKAPERHESEHAHTSLRVLAEIVDRSFEFGNRRIAGGFSALQCGTWIGFD